MKDNRYSRQRLFAPIGDAGQERIQAGRVVLVGLGAVGASAADMLTRAGIGELMLVDRDVVELSNLQRQTLYSESQAEAIRPKALAARERLQSVGGVCRLSARVMDVAANTVMDLVEGLEGGVLFDATDNFEARYLLSDLATREGVRYAYAGAIGSSAAAALFRPPATPCLRCIFPEPPPPGSYGTCDTEGVIAPAAHAAASLAVAMVLRGLVEATAPSTFVNLDVWSDRHGSIGLDESRRDPSCPSCVERRYPSLSDQSPPVVAMCGRDLYQVRGGVRELDLEQVERRAARLGRVRRQPDILRWETDEVQLTLFRDGRALVRGVDGPERARRIYSELIGS